MGFGFQQVVAFDGGVNRLQRRPHRQIQTGHVQGVEIHIDVVLARRARRRETLLAQFVGRRLAAADRAAGGGNRFQGLGAQRQVEDGPQAAQMPGLLIPEDERQALVPAGGEESCKAGLSRALQISAGSPGLSVTSKAGERAWAAQSPVRPRSAAQRLKVSMLEVSVGDLKSQYSRA